MRAKTAGDKREAEAARLKPLFRDGGKKAKQSRLKSRGIFVRIYFDCLTGAMRLLPNVVWSQKTRLFPPTTRR